MSQFKTLPHAANGVEGEVVVPGDEDSKKRRRVFAFIRTRKGKAVSAFVTGLIIVSSFAAAQWLGTQFAGPGASKASTFGNPSVLADTTAQGAATGMAYPSLLATGALYIKVTNTNPFPVKIVNISGTGTFDNTAYSVDAPHSACVGSNWAVGDNGAGGSNNPTVTGAGVVASAIPAGASSLSVVVANSIRLRETADTSCQGASPLWGATGLNYTFGT